MRVRKIKTPFGEKYLKSNYKYVKILEYIAYGLLGAFIAVVALAGV